MANLATVSFLVLLYLPKSLQNTNYSVENANTFIEQHKGNINSTYRLNYHFMPSVGWINDPNGFIYYKGEYHLFYQYNPYDTVPNKIHWGHAKSTDLLNWEHLPIALAPDQDYDDDGVFSGSAIEKDGKLYLMYTGNSKLYGQTQCIAESQDGIIFTKYAQNPVLTHFDLPQDAEPGEFRDPKVFKRGSLYYVVLASKTLQNTGQILLYQSEDLYHWEFRSVLLKGSSGTGIMWECPDLFELDGKDVLLLSPIEMPKSGNDFRNYDSVVEFIGQIDWGTGKLTVEAAKELDHGMDFYATQSLLDDRGRRIVIAWMGMWKRNYPTQTLDHGWVGAMTIPRQLHLKNNALTQIPAPNFTAVLQNTVEYKQVSLSYESREFGKVLGESGVLDLVIEIKTPAVFTIELRKAEKQKTVVTYQSATGLLILDRKNSGFIITGEENPQVHSRKVYVPLTNNELKLKLLIDKSSVEVFVNDGIESLTANIYPIKTNSTGIIFVADGTVIIKSLNYGTLLLEDAKNIPSTNIAVKLMYSTTLFLSVVTTLGNVLK